MKLDDWQRQALEHDGNLLLCTGRQVGKTTIMSIKAARYMIEHPNSQIIICSLTEDQAQLIIIMIVDYLQRFHADQIKKGGADKPTKNRIVLKNRSRAIARPVGLTGDSVRGFTGNVLILDEVSRFKEIIMDAAIPTLMTTAGQIWACSTPAGKKGWFYRTFLNKDGRFKVLHISSWEVMHERPLSESWTQEKKDAAISFIESQRTSMSPLAFGQEYLGEFMEDLTRYFTDEEINKVCIAKRSDYIDGEENFMGVDIARMGGDKTVLAIIKRVTKTRFIQKENIVRGEQYTTVTQRDIIGYDKIYNCAKVGIDAGSGALGVGIYDALLEHPTLKRKVIPMNNREIPLDKDGNKKQRIFKEDMYDNLKSMIVNGEIELLDDEDLKISLMSVQIEYTDDGKAHIFGSYTHTAEAIVRAAWLCKKEKINKLWISYM